MMKRRSLPHDEENDGGHQQEFPEHHDTSPGRSGAISGSEHDRSTRSSTSAPQSSGQWPAEGIATHDRQ